MEWKAVGAEFKGSEPVYLVEAAGRLWRLRQSQIIAAHALLALDPDADRWRALFPHSRRPGKFDAYAAGAMVMRECIAAQQRRDNDEVARALAAMGPAVAAQ